MLSLLTHTKTNSVVKAVAGFSLLMALFVSDWINPVRSISARQPGGNSGLVPASLLKWEGKDSPYAILVDKSLQKVFLYHKDNPYTPRKVYRCSTGENGGPKTRQNDKRTPEGIYFFTQTYEGKELAPIYGIRAIALDYPNPLDKKEGRGGYGIWFHGLNKPLRPNDTNGCIAMENQDIDELFSHITLNDTPVIVSSKIEMVDPQRLKGDKEKLEKTIEDWRLFWERKEIDRYMSLYSPEFTSGGKDWQAWKRYKGRLAKSYKGIHVDIDNLELLSNDGVVLARFIQRYGTKKFRSEGEKTLFLKQNSDQWKIVGEFFKRAKIERPTLAKIEKPAVAKAQVPSIKEVEEFISQWRNAWESKDLSVYVSCYDSGFRSRGMDLRAWEEHRRGLNEKYQSLTVKITDLEIIMNSPKTVKVTFKQRYEADGYHDVGLKKMELFKEGRHWKIKGEEWKPLSKRKSR
ncbi:MAG: L,D-transpeptidase family protein [Pseudomonadota bacterium]